MLELILNVNALWDISTMVFKRVSLALIISLTVYNAALQALALHAQPVLLLLQVNVSAVIRQNL